jgi:xanthine dehydrogenase accessory factor
MVGYLSNGCIDRDIQLQALQVLEAEEGARVLRYGEGSPFKDLTLPCGGALTLFLEPDPDAATLRAALVKLKAREPAHLIKGIPGGDKLTLTYDPKPRLVLAGRGAVFRATAEVAASAGFEIGVFSPETEDLEALSQLRPFTSEHLTTPQSAPELPLDAYSACLTLFHDHDWEPALIQSALMSNARFIGCLGSQRTHFLRLEALRARGVPETDLARVSGPIGLVPSLRQAPSIAVSAVAQLVSVFPEAIHASMSEPLVGATD